MSEVTHHRIGCKGCEDYSDRLQDAAAEIERLEAEVEQLRNGKRIHKDAAYILIQERDCTVKHLLTRADQAERERDALRVALERIARLDCDGPEYDTIEEDGHTCEWCAIVARAALDAGKGEG